MIGVYIICYIVLLTENKLRCHILFKNMYVYRNVIPTTQLHTLYTHCTMLNTIITVITATRYK